MHVPSQQLTQATGSCHALSTSADAHTTDIPGLIKVSGEESSRAMNVDVGVPHSCAPVLQKLMLGSRHQEDLN